MGAFRILTSPYGRIACLALGLAALSGCSSLRSTFGFERNPPDEFRVVARAPLEVPGTFTLPPPSPGATRPQEGTPTEMAASTLFGAASTPAQPAGAGSGANLGAGEARLLAQAGASEARPDIRSMVNQEAAAAVVADRSFIDRLIFWQDQMPPGTVVNPDLEARRLRENAALGRPVTQGRTPVIERRRRAPLEGVFDGLL
ncbi:MAG TPA: DUF3035 domain-containing protein [Arenibaculum sp.]|nr:DUF3035 domain-containing protein [Arenibaculum sp.]